MCDLREDGDAVVTLSRRALTRLAFAMVWYNEKFLWRRAKRTLVEPKTHTHGADPEEEQTEADGEDEQDVYGRRGVRFEVSLVRHVVKDLGVQ
jgi:hypothetical protein